MAKNTLQGQEGEGEGFANCDTIIDIDARLILLLTLMIY